jgi:hypothetical protein
MMLKSYRPGCKKLLEFRQKAGSWRFRVRTVLKGLIVLNFEFNQLILRDSWFRSGSSLARNFQFRASNDLLFAIG